MHNQSQQFVSFLQKAFTIDKNSSLCIKGVAVIFMVLVHFWGNSVFSFHENIHFNGIVCISMFAFVTGYAHKLLSGKGPYIMIRKFLKTFFVPFYTRYLFTIVLVFLLYKAASTLCEAGGVHNTLSIKNLVYITTLYKPNAAHDSWWYAFAFTSFCLILYPLLRYIDITSQKRPVLFHLSALILIVASFSIPIVSTRLGGPAELIRIWGYSPVLRTCFVVPYYILGYSLCKNISEARVSVCNISMSCLMMCCCVLWPFELYGIDQIHLLNTGTDFLVAMGLVYLLSLISGIKNILIELGKISLYLWLLHMPVRELIGITHLTTQSHNVNIISLLASVVLSFISAKAYNSFSNCRLVRKSAN